MLRGWIALQPFQIFLFVILIVIAILCSILISKDEEAGWKFFMMFVLAAIVVFITNLYFQMR